MLPQLVGFRSKSRFPHAGLSPVSQVELTLPFPCDALLVTTLRADTDTNAPPAPKQEAAGTSLSERLAKHPRFHARSSSRDNVRCQDLRNSKPLWRAPRSHSSLGRGTFTVCCPGCEHVSAWDSRRGGLWPELGKPVPRHWRQQNRVQIQVLPIYWLCDLEPFC